MFCLYKSSQAGVGQLLCTGQVVHEKFISNVLQDYLECDRHSSNICILTCSPCHEICPFTVWLYHSSQFNVVRAREIAAKSCGILSERGHRSDPQGEEKCCEVIGDGAPQLHHLTELMKLFVMGFSAAFGSRRVISGQISAAGLRPAHLCTILYVSVSNMISLDQLWH